MQVYPLLIDSRHREVNTPIYAPTFRLSQPIHGVKHVKVKWTSYGNLTHNIRSSNNTFTISQDSGTTYLDVSIPTGFYTPTDLVDAINTASPIPTDIVSFVEANNTLSWSLPTGVVLNGMPSSMYNILGISQTSTYINSFSSTLYLALPNAISFSCPQLQSHSSIISTSGQPDNGAIFTVPITVGYGQTGHYEESDQNFINLNGVNLSQLSFSLKDIGTGEVLKESAHWAMQLYAYC